MSVTPAATDVPHFDGLRILIVDDDVESCEMMVEALRRYGASVQCAMSATEATARPFSSADGPQAQQATTRVVPAAPVVENLGDRDPDG